MSQLLARLLLGAALLLTACGSGAHAAAPPDAPPAAAKAITAPAAAPESASGAFSGTAALDHVQHLAAAIGPRPAGGETATTAAGYIADQLASYGYTVERQPFTFPQFEERSAALTVTRGDSAQEPPFATHALFYSGSGAVSGRLVFAGYGLPTDFSGLDLKGTIAVMERGADVTFRDKAERAFQAGAVGVVIYNNTPREFLGSLQVRMPLPVIALSGEEGQRLRRQMAGAPAAGQLTVDASVDDRWTENVIATRPAAAGATAAAGAAGQRTVVLAAHYDSVAISPGANDNGSGVAVMLELARALAHEAPSLTLTFVAFGGEELGLLGSAHYVGTLSPEARGAISAMLNFDMVGVGDEVLVGGSAPLVRTIDAAGGTQGLALGRMGSSLNGRSDHASFLAAGIPSAFFYVSDDPNYHTPGDVAANVSAQRLAQVGALGTEVVRRLGAA